MAIKKINTEFQLLDKFLDTSGNAGTSGQVLSSTGTGVNWVSGGSLPGGPYLPLSAGSTKPLSGVLYAGQGVKFTGGTIASATTVLHTNNVVYARGGSSGMFLQNADGSDGMFIANDHIRFDTSSTERMRITTAGRVGIGVTGPSALFEVNAADGVMVDTFMAYFKNSEATAGDNFGLKIDAGTNSSDVSMQINNSSASALMRVRGDGNVGIGTTSPVTKLNVAGNISVTSTKAYRMYNAANTGWGEMNFVEADNRIQFNRGIQNSGVDWRLSEDSASSYVCALQGNFGVGTTSPDAKLDVVGDLQISNNKTNATNKTNRIKGQHYTNTEQPVTFMFSNNFSSTNTLFIGGGSTIENAVTSMGFYTGGTNTTTQGSLAMLIDNSQNVGIGLTNPSTPLHVAGIVQVVTNSNPAFYEGNGVRVFGSQSYNFRNTPGNVRANINVEATGANAGNLSLYNASNVITTKLNNAGDSYLNGGNVGIGTTSPANKLSIQGSQATVYSPTDSGGQASSGVTINNTNTAGNTNNFSQLLFTVGTNNNSLSRIVCIRSGSDASDLAFVGKKGSTVGEYMRIANGGNVGIGINNPSSLLEVRDGTVTGQIAKFSAVNAHVVIESTTAGNAVLHLKPNQTGSKSGQFKVTAGNGYNFRWSNDAAGTGEVAYMDLDTSTTGGGDLTVKGDVIAYGSPSDKKYKENIKPIESALDKAMQLQGVTFDWKDSESILEIKEDIGFIAQDVQEVLPELVRDNGKGNLSLRYQGITPILLEAIKELKAEIEELKLNNCNCNK